MVPSSSLRKQRSYFEVEGQKVMGVQAVDDPHELELLKHFDIGDFEHVLYNSESNALHIIWIHTLTLKDK